MKDFLHLKHKTWVTIIAVAIISLIAVLIWQSDKWYALYTELAIRTSGGTKSNEPEQVVKSGRYDGLHFESNLTPKQLAKINDFTLSFKKILILFETKSLYTPDLEDVAQEMYAAESGLGRDEYSYYQSQEDRKEERDADSLSADAPPPKIIFSGMDTVALMKIPGFSPELPDNLKRDLDIIIQFGINRFIIDLRDNDGGLDNSAVLALSLFMRRGDIMCTRRDRSAETIYNKKYLAKVLKASNIGKYEHLRQIVLLVNRNTASAAEIFAGAMQEWGYTLIGEKTFGKGVGQEYFNLPAPVGSVFILTTREYLIGREKKRIDGIGLTPNILIRNSKLKDSPDFQLEAAIEFLRNKTSGN